ncbi:MAG: hypothetical protein M1825_004473 [Sarcosagium campestre]|nr:MAG: hypothetical protein M1825_004473 [Sarcosagium campestre]
MTFAHAATWALLLLQSLALDVYLFHADMGSKSREATHVCRRLLPLECCQAPRPFQGPYREVRVVEHEEDDMVTLWSKYYPSQDGCTGELLYADAAPKGLWRWPYAPGAQDGISGVMYLNIEKQPAKVLNMQFGHDAEELDHYSKAFGVRNPGGWSNGYRRRRAVRVVRRNESDPDSDFVDAAPVSITLDGDGQDP